jgi:flagellar hook-basal body complex protein FliE
MDISSISGISTNLYDTISSSINATDSDDSFSSVLASMMSAVSETNDLQNEAEAAEIQFALGETSNTNDLTVATTKALIAIQYTTAVRDKLVDGYKELMQMSI